MLKTNFTLTNYGTLGLQWDTWLGTFNTTDVILISDVLLPATCPESFPPPGNKVRMYEVGYWTDINLHTLLPIAPQQCGAVALP